MIKQPIGLPRRYVTALRRHLKHGPNASLLGALRLGREAVASGLETLDLAQIHEESLILLKLSGTEAGRNRQAERFFTEALAPIEETHHAARQCKTDLKRLNETLTQRTKELAATNRQVQRGILGRRRVEVAFKKSGDRYSRLLKDSLQLQDGLRQLAHQVMAAQEDQRRNISRELRDEIAQTLVGINVRLVSLKKEARVNAKCLKNEIASTQRLVLKSAKSVGRVAREFRNV